MCDGSRILFTAMLDRLCVCVQDLIQQYLTGFVCVISFTALFDICVSYSNT